MNNELLFYINFNKNHLFLIILSISDFNTIIAD